MSRVFSLISGVYHSSTLAKICLIILATQSAILVLLYLAHCIDSLVQGIVAPIRKRRQEEIARSIESLLFDSMSDGLTKQNFSLPRFYWFEKSTVKELIFSYLVELKGEAKTSLFRLYNELGFLNVDIQQLSSRRWWKRLHAAAKLQRIGMDETDRELKLLLNDPYPFVAELVTQHFDRQDNR